MRNPALMGAASSLAMRRGILSTRMEGGDSPAEIRALIAGIQTAFSSFKEANDKRLEDLEKKNGDVVTNEKVDRINASLSDLTQRLANMNLNGNNGNANGATADQKAYSKGFGTYFRKGVDNGLHDLAVKAALTVGSDPDGGWVVPSEVETTIDRVLTKTSAMRQLATVRTLGAASYKKPVNVGGTSTGWVGETGPRPQTANAQLSLLEFPAMELYAEPAATQSLLDDANLDIASWLADEVSLVFAEQEGSAFVSGDGNAKPFGVMSYGTVADANWKWGKLGYIQIGAGGVLPNDGTAFDGMLDMQGAVKMGYRAGSAWLMNRKTEATMRKIKDPEGHYLWQPALQPGAIPSLSGYGVYIDDNMDDIGANKFPVALGDFKRGYVIVDRIGIRVIRDNVTQKPYVLFYTTKRVGGGVQNFEAIKLGKVAA